MRKVKWNFVSFGLLQKSFFYTSKIFKSLKYIYCKKLLLLIFYNLIWETILIANSTLIMFRESSSLNNRHFYNQLLLFIFNKL